MLAKEFNTNISFKKRLSKDIYILGFNIPYIAKEASPGQFLHIKIDDSLTILRRPFSIHRVIKNKVYILFRVRGKGTRLLSCFDKNSKLNIIGPLGNGFEYKNKNLNILLAGGMGVAPLYFLAERLKEYNLKENTVLLGAKNKGYVLLDKEFKKLGYKTFIATEDGSVGFKGNVVELLKEILPSLKEDLNIYACGPKEMFFEVYKIIKPYKNINCYVSFEQFMGCGLGICLGCVINTKYGYKRICKDGPVFNLKELNWR